MLALRSGAEEHSGSQNTSRTVLARMAHGMRNQQEDMIATNAFMHTGEALVAVSDIYDSNVTRGSCISVLACSIQNYFKAKRLLQIDSPC